MKKVALILAGFIMAFAAVAEQNKKHEVLDTFSDTIVALNEMESGLRIEFATHAGFYYLSKKDSHFLEKKAKLDKLKKEEKKVKISAVIPKMEIKDVTE